MMKINQIMSISKILTNLYSIRQNIKIKKHFCRYCLQCFISKRVLVEHKKTCLKINGEQAVKSRSGLIKFKNHFNQFALPFKIYADFECNLEKIILMKEVMILHIMKKIM